MARSRLYSGLSMPSIPNMPCFLRFIYIHNIITSSFQGALIPSPSFSSYICFFFSFITKYKQNKLSTLFSSLSHLRKKYGCIRYFYSFCRRYITFYSCHRPSYEKSRYKQVYILIVYL